MKANKLDLTQPLVLETYIPGQEAPIEVHGLPELLIDLNVQEQARADRAEQEVKTHKVRRNIAKPVLEAVRTSSDTFLGRIASNLQVVAYDKIHHTDMWEQLRQKRADDRDVAFAAKIGLLTVEETYCRKHQHAVEKLRG